MTNAYERKVLSKVGKTSDIEVHVSLLSAEVNGTEQELVDIREYVVSLDMYGRGITFSKQVKDVVLEGLKKV